MPVEGTKKSPPRAKSKLWILLTVVFLVGLTLMFLGTRLNAWRQEREKTKLLTLVDRDHPIEDDYNVEFTLLGEGQMVDSRCVDDLEAMLEACRRAGGQPSITASFRTWGAQERAYEEALAALTEEGLSPEETAERDALRREYVAAVKASLTHHLDHTWIVDEKGNKRPLPRKERPQDK